MFLLIFSPRNKQLYLFLAIAFSYRQPWKEIPVIQIVHQNEQADFVRMIAISGDSLRRELRVASWGAAVAELRVGELRVGKLRVIELQGGELRVNLLIK